MPIQLLLNHNYPIGNIINQKLQNANKAQFAVAFLKFSGVKEIKNALHQCLNNGGTVEIIAGLDFKTTDPQSIHYFLNLKKNYLTINFYCFGDKGANKTNIVFHPKIYLFEKGRETTGIVGSTNLTKGGLTSNFEVNTIFKETKPVYFSQFHQRRTKQTRSNRQAPDNTRLFIRHQEKKGFYALTEKGKQYQGR